MMGFQGLLPRAYVGDVHTLGTHVERLEHYVIGVMTHSDQGA